MSLTKFTIKEANYGERGYRRQTIYIGEEELFLDVNENPDRDERQIYIDGKLTFIKDIIYSFIDYYKLKINTMTDYDFYKNNIKDLSITLNAIYDSIDNIASKADINLDDLYSKSFNTIEYYEDETKYDIRHVFNTNDSFDIKIILTYMYKYELSKINTFLPNYTIIEEKGILSFEEARCVDYIDKSVFIDSILDTINSEQELKLKNLISNSIYDYLYNSHHIDENKLRNIYKSLGIEAKKLVINNSDYKIAWIMKELHTIPNILIPTVHIDSRLNDIMKYSRNEGDTIYIEYNTNASNNMHIAMYLIDKLHTRLAEKMLMIPTQSELFHKLSLCS